MSIDDEPRNYWNRLGKNGKFILVIGLLLSTANAVRTNSLSEFIYGLVITLILVQVFG